MSVSTAGGTTDDPFAYPSCTLRVEPAADHPRRLAFGLTCNYRVMSVTLDASRPLRGFRRTLRRTPVEPRDETHTCEQTDRSQVTCRAPVRGAGEGGGAGSGVTMDGWLRFKRPVCEKPRVRLHVVAEGGPDQTCTEERPCSLIGSRRELSRRVAC